MRKLLKHIVGKKDYTLLLLGQFISKLGSSINGIGLSLYVLRFENPIWGLGTLMLLLTIPWIILSPFAGIIADRYSKKTIIVLCDILRGILGIALFYTKELVIFYVIVFTLTALDVIFSPAISGFLPFIVGEKDIEEANSIYSASGQLAGLIGPALGGILVAMIGTSGVFLVNGISYILSGISEIFISSEGKVNIDKGKGIKTSVFNEIKEGILYAKENKKIGFVILFFAVASVAFGGLPILYLDYIQHNLGASEKLFGFFMTVSGLGTLLGALMLPKLPKRWSSFDIMVAGTGVYGFLFLLFVSWKFIPYNMLIFFLIGIFTSFINVSYGIFLQQNVEKELIGRVFSLDMTLSNITMLVSIITITFAGERYSNILQIIILALLMGFISIIGTLKSKYNYQQKTGG